MAFSNTGPFVVDHVGGNLYTGGNFFSNKASGSVAYIFDTTLSYSGYLFQWKNNGTGVAIIDQFGTFFTNGDVEAKDFRLTPDGGTTTQWVLQPLGSNIIEYSSHIADSAGAEAHRFNTFTNYTTAGAKLVSIENNSVQKVYVDKDGNTAPGSDLGASLGAAANRWTSLFGATLKDGGSVNRMIFNTTFGNVYISGNATSGTSVAHLFNTNANYTTAGDKLASFQNLAVEKVFITKDGGGFFNSKLGVGQSIPDGQLDVSQTNLPNSATLFVTTNASVTGNNQVGMYSDVEISGTYASSGGHDQAIAIEGDVYHHGSGNINFVTGVAGYFQSDGTGTIGQGRVLSSLAPSITGGTVTELCGIYMEEMVGATTNYAIKYTHGTNPFTLTGPGKVGIGTLTANAQLSINAAGSSGDNLFIQGPTASSYLELYDTVESDWEVTKTNGDKVVPLYTAAISNPTSPAGNEAVSHYADAFHGGTSSIPLIGAIAGYCENNGTGTTTVAIPLRARAVVNSGGGTITEVIGLQIEHQTVGGTNWAIKHGTTTDNHFFAYQGNGVPSFSFTDGSGTPGNQTINKTTGKGALAAGASSVTITDDRITANSIVQIQIEGSTFDATATRFQVTYGSGNFVVRSNANATGNVVFNWRICN